MKNTGLAAILGFFFPGVGQIYNGQFGKAVAFFIANVVNFLLTFIIVGFLTGFITALISAYDAYRSAEKINTTLAL